MPLDGLIPGNRIEQCCRRQRRTGKKIVFTNGVFDILHRGHVDYLHKAKALGDVLIVGLNTDASARRLKGKGRPLQNQRDRAAILLALKAVDFVVFFSEDRPDRLIERVRPEVLVKGADYRLSEIAGADFVHSYGGTVRRIRLAAGKSSSLLEKKLRSL